jgi:Ca-activated chloride channel family protein
MNASKLVFAMSVLGLSGCASQMRVEEVRVEEVRQETHEVVVTSETSAYAPEDLDTSVVAGHLSAPDGPVANPVQRTAAQPTSTFSIDVDTGAYSTARGALAAGRLPRPNTVRTEEFLNYFDYGYPAPVLAGVPFNVYTEVAPAPWDRDRLLLLVGIKGYEVKPAALPPANLVFLVDTSGSMKVADKLPLVKDTLRLVAEKLRPQDRVAIVVYAGSAGLVLPPTPGNERAKIVAAIDRLEAGGTTNGGEGLMLAYAIADATKQPGSINRVILATDGDFNVGLTSREEMQALIEAERESGVALTTLGFGDRDWSANVMEQLADAGNGNHAYIDHGGEARKVLDEELAATMLTIAQDVKVQLEFNPTVVAEYRLVGYENRVLANEDFANDAVDAGDIGAGHDVTALYELTLVGSPATRMEPAHTPVAATALPADALAQLRLRYKRPGEAASALIQRTMSRNEIQPVAGARLQLAAAIAAFAERLRGGGAYGDFGLADAAALARGVALPDPYGYRSELVHLIELARLLRNEPDGGATFAY